MPCLLLPAAPKPSSPPRALTSALVTPYLVSAPTPHPPPALMCPRLHKNAKIPQRGRGSGRDFLRREPAGSTGLSLGGKILSHTPPPWHLKSGKMADKTRDVSSRNGVVRPRHRQRKSPSRHPKLHTPGARHRPESARIRPFGEHPGSNLSAPAAPGTTPERVHATGTAVTGPRMSRATRLPGGKEVPHVGRRRGQPRGNSPGTLSPHPRSPQARGRASWLIL